MQRCRHYRTVVLALECQPVIIADYPANSRFDRYGHSPAPAACISIDTVPMLQYVQRKNTVFVEASASAQRDHRPVRYADNAIQGFIHVHESNVTQILSVGRVDG